MVRACWDVVHPWQAIKLRLPGIDAAVRIRCPFALASRHELLRSWSCFFPEACGSSSRQNKSDPPQSFWDVHIPGPCMYRGYTSPKRLEQAGITCPVICMHTATYHPLLTKHSTDICNRLQSSSLVGTLYVCRNSSCMHLYVFLFR